MPLFRYLAATHTGLPATLRSNADQLVNSGAYNGVDRLVLGRALLHDIADFRAEVKRRKKVPL